VLTSGVHSLAWFSSQRSRRLCRVLMMGGLVVATAGAMACGGDKTPPAGTVSMLPPVGVRPPSPGDPACPRTGKWAPCSLVDRIIHAGLSFKPTGDSVKVAFISVPGVRYRVAMTDTLLAFYFADSTALKQALTKLDTVRMTPKAATDTTLPWPALPNVIRSGNLLALYFAKSDRQVERIKLAITAGAPAP
jgi:hypothetical protein